MLILSRKLHESVTIEMPDGRHLTVGISRIGANAIGLGIQAPHDVRIGRTELMSPKPIPPILRIGDKVGPQ